MKNVYPIAGKYSLKDISLVRLPKMENSCRHRYRKMKKEITGGVAENFPYLGGESRIRGLREIWGCNLKP